MAFALTCHVANSSRCRYWIASLAMAFALTCHVAAANENLKTDKTPEKSDRTALIDITIETSRSQPTAGDGLGVSADIKNVSDSVIHFEGEEIDLVLPPELLGPGQSSYGSYALLPTEPNGKVDAWKTSINLNPGDSYKVFWTQGGSRYYTQQELDQQSYLRKIYNVISAEMNFIFFPPGDYKIAVVCKYSPLIDSKPATYRTTVQTATIHVAAPQFVILFGAALGGLLAYFILPQARARLVKVSVSTDRGSAIGRITSRLLKELAGVLGAVLLSTMITILLSRISETQFLIKVTITDLWGAIAIGFIANYAGAKALDKILGGTRTSKSQKAVRKSAPAHNG
jgi:hypothetical protein